MELIFWSSIAFIAYVYGGYPLLIAAWSRLARRQPGGSHSVRSFRRPSEPGVSIIVAARDEAHRLPERIQNLLESCYPADLMQIIVASDGSTDDTARVLEPFGERVEFLDLPRGGKAVALNAAVARARYPILVFADARQRFAPDAIRHLTSHFADPSIGAVSGELLIDSGNSTIGDGVGAYWQYEKWLRRREAIVGSTIGVTGAIYAMRRDLWQPLPADTILDDVLGPIRVVLAGYRVIFDERAHAYDQAARDASAELRRKTRTLAGNFQLLRREPRLLVPFVNPVWLQFVSHKLARLLVPYALIALFVSSAVLALDSVAYGVACAGQGVFYALACYGALLDQRERPGVARGEAYREAA